MIPRTYELDELLDSSVSLSDWVDRSGAPAPPVATFVNDDEVCATTPTRTLAPYESEYEGYMGNYGNTMDRWYRRGAVVVWPTRLDFEVRAEASPQWALDTLQALIRDGELTRAREQAESLSLVLAGPAHGRSPRASGGPQAGSGPALAVAHGLDDAELAAMMLAPFRLEELTPANAALLAALAQRHGERWTRNAARRLEQPAPLALCPGSEAGWLAALPELCRALRDANGLWPPAWCSGLRGNGSPSRIRQARGITQPSRRAQALDQLAAPIAGLLVGAAISAAPEIVDAAVAVFPDTDDAVCWRCLVGVLRALPQDDPEVRAGSGFDALARNALVPTGVRGRSAAPRPGRLVDRTAAGVQLPALRHTQRLPGRSRAAGVGLAAQGAGPATCPRADRRARTAGQACDPAGRPAIHLATEQDAGAVRAGEAGTTGRRRGSAVAASGRPLTTLGMNQTGSGRPMSSAVDGW